MPHHPSRRLESVLAPLLPPACREHVLGDLAECAETRGQYIGVFIAILLKVVLSATRRTLRWGNGVGLMAGLSAIALVIAALITSDFRCSAAAPSLVPGPSVVLGPLSPLVVCNWTIETPGRSAEW